MTAALFNTIVPRALIVEDRPEVAKMWADLLKPLGILIFFAETLQEGLEQIRKIPPPDLILLDLALTDSMAANTVNNIDVIKELAPDSAIMVVSGMVTPELHKIAVQKGAHAVLHKLEIKRQTDLWNGIQRALNRAPKAAHDRFEHTLKLMETLVLSLT